ncbi:hypothetical protein [Kribbella sp. DT2]|uniref:hypothetical protein n=1 Tax=Kribbella sp. DT2 TaxID=3393427 RepID=UPI003CF0685F
MNDTETRLRDYLQAKANTVSDDAESPGLITPRTRSRVWTPLLAAAVVAVLIASAVLVAHLINPPVQPARPATSLNVPYLLRPLEGDRTLHDGDQVVGVPKDVSDVVGRVSGGWLISYDSATNTHIAVVAADGTRRPIGSATGNAHHAVLSPDRTQVAVVEGTKLQVYDVASGRSLATRALPYEAALHGWNQAGIWVSKLSDQAVSQMSVWQPRTGQLTPATLPGTTSFVDVAQQAGGILMATSVGKQHCLTYAQLPGGRLTTGRPYCEQEPLHPVVSPDGATFALPDSVVDLRTGKRTPFQLAQAHVSEAPSFEDADHVLVVQALRDDGRPASPMVSIGTPAQELPHDTVFRCTVESGACEKVLTAPDLKSVRLIKP